MTHAPELFSEAIPLGEAVKSGRVGRKFPALLIKQGWSLNDRFYSEALLKEYGPKAFKAGALMRSDHPTADERAAKPEGSIRDVVSVLASDAKWSDKHGGLVAEVEIMPQHEGLLNERFAKAIGLSIRAYGTAEYGEIDGHEGMILTSFGEGSTVDWVTHPGAGGRVIDVLESAPPTFREAHGLSANTLHIALSKAVEIAHGRDGCRHWVYVCDYDDAWLVFDIYGDREDTGRFRQDYTVDAAGTVTLVGDPVPVNTQTIYVPAVASATADESTTESAPADVPAPPADPAPAAPSAVPTPVAEATDPLETTTKEAVVTTPAPTGAPPAGAASTVTESSTATLTLEEARKYAAQMEAEATAARAIAESKADDRASRIKAEADASAARNETARFRAMEGARSTTQIALNESGLPECVFSRVLATVTGHEGRALPLTESHAIDGDKLKVKVAEAIRDWQVLVGQILEANGLDGRVKGLGTTSQPEGLTAVQAQESMKERFIRSGMSADAAAVAAAGRG